MRSARWIQPRYLQAVIVLGLLAHSFGTVAAAKEDIFHKLLRRAESYGKHRQYDQAFEVLDWAWRASRGPTEKARARLAQADLLVEYSRYPAPWLTSTEIDRSGADSLSPSPIAAMHEIQRAARSYYRDAIDYAGREGGDTVVKIAAVNNLALLRKEQGNAAAAARLLARHLEEVPPGEQAKFLYNYGVTLEAAKRRQEAFNVYVRAARTQTDFLEPLEEAGRLAGRRSLPGCAPRAVELVRFVREAGSFILAEDLLSTFLKHESWFDSPEYEKGLLRELVHVFISSELVREAFDSSWSSVLEELLTELPDTPRGKVQGILRAFRSDTESTEFVSSTGDPYADWQSSAEDRILFAGLFKALGDSAFRQGSWHRALALYRRAREMDPENLDTAVYLFNLIALAPPDIDPSGDVASALAKELDAFATRSPQEELAGIYQLAGAALQTRGRTAEAIGVWEKALQLSKESSSLRPGLRRRLADAHAYLSGAAPRRPEIAFNRANETAVTSDIFQLKFKVDSPSEPAIVTLNGAPVGEPELRSSFGDGSVALSFKIPVALEAKANQFTVRVVTGEGIASEGVLSITRAKPIDNPDQ